MNYWFPQWFVFYGSDSLNKQKDFLFCLTYASPTIPEHHSHNQKLPVCQVLQLQSELPLYLL